MGMVQHLFLEVDRSRHHVYLWCIYYVDVFGCFACIYVCEPHVCLVTLEA